MGSNFLQVLCPCAQPKHLRMFDVWCIEYDASDVKHDKYRQLEEMVSNFRARQDKPVMPIDEVARLEREFDKLDHTGQGFITMNDIMKGWGWSSEKALAVIMAYDIVGDSFINKSAFFGMMCPPEYRPPHMDGFSFDSFGKLMESEVKDRRWSLECVKKDNLEIDKILPAPPTAFPEVPENLLEQWKELFDDLDRDEDDTVCVQELESSGLLSAAECSAVANIIDPICTSAFSREGFLMAMCKAHGYRWKLSDSLKA